MAAYKGYTNEAGQRIPSTTTISGKFKDSGGLMWWANAVGLGERDCDDQKPCRHCGRRAGKWTREIVRAAETGTYAHALIDHEVKGVEVDVDTSHFTPEQFEQVERCMSAFRKWWKAYDVEIADTEVRLVSESMQYGGTFDAVGRVSGTFALIDWKTSKAIYSDYLVQLAGYCLLIEESGMFPAIEEVHILRVSKETAGFDHKYIPMESFGPAIDYFKQARSLYDAVKPLEAVMK